VGLGVKTTSLSAIWQALGWNPVSADVLVTGVTSDSRQIVAGNLFIACVGDPQRLRSFIEQAQAKQAAAVAIDVHQLSLVDTCNFTVPIFGVPDLAENQGYLAAQVLSKPSDKLLLVGITGTNGKTSISHYVAQACSYLAHTCGVIGTTGNGLLADLKAGPNTTPDAVSVQALLADMQAQGARACAMEVSSHGLHQGRVNACEFDIAVLSNLSRDHLDYHGSMEQYGEAKARLFSWPKLKHAVINADDSFGLCLLNQLAKNVHTWTYSVRSGSASANIYATNVRFNQQGMQADITTPLGNIQVCTELFGEFNLSNLLATVGVLLAAGFDLKSVSQALTQLQPVAGRMEKTILPTGVIAIVDYAHTPDALQAALQATRQHVQSGSLWCVFGCGGDRDTGKRPLMGQIAEQLADQVVVTDDNPRFEASASIIEQIKHGFRVPEAVTLIADRKSAIAHTLSQAKAGDIVLIAGKGHEDYQEIGGQREHFSDREQVAIVAQELAQ